MVTIYIVLLILILIIGYNINKFWERYRFKKKIEFWLKDDYKILSNIYYKTSFAITYIDYILITHKGIFILKIKKLGNVDISGSIKGKNWSVAKPHAKRYDTPIVKRYEINNPIIEKNRDLKTIKMLLGMKENVYSLVIYPNKVVFNKTISKNVIIEEKFHHFYLSKSGNQLTSIKIKKYYDILNNSRIRGLFIGIKYYLFLKFRKSSNAIK